MPALIFLLFASLLAAQETLIRRVTVADVSTGAERKDQTVTIRGQRIASLAPTQDTDTAKPGAIDAHGAHLIPARWDMHVHVHDTSELPLDIANSVTCIRIASGEKNTAALRAKLARESPVPEIYLASAIVDGSPPAWPGSIVVGKAADFESALLESPTNRYN